MNTKLTAQKAEGLLNSSGLPQGEVQFLHSLFEFIGSAKGNPVPEIASAAKEWERILEFRIRVTLQRR